MRNYLLMLWVLVLTCSLITESKSQNVDPFTGDMSYSLPLMTVPSADGPGVPIVLNYKAGIRNNQQASWVGLGWSLDMGSINRGIRGVADDAEGVRVLNLKNERTQPIPSDSSLEPAEETYMYGPLAYGEFYNNGYTEVDLSGPNGGDGGKKNANRSMDIYTSYLPNERAGFEYPNYDNYIVSGSGLNGLMRPFLFSNGSLVTETNNDFTISTPASSNSSYNWGSSYNDVDDYDKIDFVFTDEFSTAIKVVENAGSFCQNDPTHFRYKLTKVEDAETIDFDLTTTGLIYYLDKYEFTSQCVDVLDCLHNDMPITYNMGNLSLTIEQLPDPITVDPTCGINQAVDFDSYTLNYQKGAETKKNVRFYTNQEIEDNYNIVSSPVLGGFIDCYEINYLDRASSVNGRDDNRIGAFSITNESGFTYHYSLPIYKGDETTLIFQTDKVTRSSLFTTINVDGENGIIRQEKEGSFASSWKLTAITGPDYIDINKDRKVGEGDRGYWVSYRYGLLDNEINMRTPLYGWTKFWNEDKRIETFYRSDKVEEFFKYQKQGSIQLSKHELYYLDYIETSSHIAFFVKDVRLDDYGVGSNNIYSVNKPKLHLERIILMDKADKETFLNHTNISLSSLTSDFNLTNYGNGMIHKGVYNSNMADINAASLGMVVLGHDYSLANKYHHNINYNSAATFITFQHITANINSYSSLGLQETCDNCTNTCSSCGKLTLKSVKSYGYGAYSKDPSHAFEYGYNPDYRLHATDAWGYYMDDYTGSTSQLNKVFEQLTDPDHVHAWSLTKITIPSGGTKEIVYESDEYHKVASFLEDDLSRQRPTKSFGFNSATMNNNTSGVDVTMTPEFKAFVNSENANNNIHSYSFIQPYIDYDCPYQDIVNRFKGVYDASYTLAFVDSNSDDLSNTNNDWSTPCGTGTIPSSPNINGGVFGEGAISVHLKKAYGGGIRVKEIITTDRDREIIDDNGNIYNTKTYKTKYNYNNSGVASKEPNRFAPNYYNQQIRNYDISSILGFSPAVSYSRVEISTEGEGGTSGETSMIYDFYNYDEPECEPFSATLNNDFYTLTSGSGGLFFVDGLYARQAVNIVDNRNQYLGKTKRIATYDYLGNQLSLTENTYEETDGRIGEMHSKRVNGSKSITYSREPYKPWLFPSAYDINLQSTSYYSRSYKSPLLLSGQRTMSNGVETTYKVTERDEVTGIPLRTETYDLSTREEIITEKTPAYQLDLNSDNILDYPAMGLRWDDFDNENQLGAIGMEKVYKSGRLISGYYNTYRNDLPTRKLNNTGDSYETVVENDRFWTEHKTFVFNRKDDEYEGLWKDHVENTMYNERGMVIEQKSKQGEIERYSATKYGYDNRYPIASIGNGRYEEFAYCGAEDPIDGTDYFGGEVKGVNSNNFKSLAHTGTRSLALNANEEGFIYEVDIDNTDSGVGLDKDRTYKASVWVSHEGAPASLVCEYYDSSETLIGIITNDISSYYTGPISIPFPFSSNSAIPNSSLPKNHCVIDGYEWTLGCLEIPTTYENILASKIKVYIKKGHGRGSCIVDDFRFHPLDYPITTYVYDEKRGLVTAMLNEENFATFYEYDGMGRVIRTAREDLDKIRITNQTRYNYKRGND